MRYGNPSVEKVLRELRERNLTRLLVVPLYPQYAASTTASAFDAIAARTDGVAQPAGAPDGAGISIDDPGYIAALAARIRRHWETEGRAEKLVMSFHGLPRRSLILGDPYHCECLATARLLADELGLRPDQWIATFQSRFGRARWLEPYTLPTLLDLAEAGTRAVDLVCPGFVADCLETLEEIYMEAREAFLAAGGTAFNYIACLNESAYWIGALADLAQSHMWGWPVTPPAATDPERSPAALARRQALARERGRRFSPGNAAFRRRRPGEFVPDGS